MGDILTIPEIAALLKISVSHAYRLAQTGQLPGAAKIGGSWRISKDELTRRFATGSHGRGTTDPSAPVPCPDCSGEGHDNGGAPRDIKFMDDAGCKPCKTCHGTGQRPPGSSTLPSWFHRKAGAR